MPILIWHYRSEDDSSAIFIGVCEFLQRDTFEPKVKKLCEAFNWDFKNINTQFGHTNYLNKNLVYL
jgi:hypothetical protein